MSDEQMAYWVAGMVSSPQRLGADNTLNVLRVTLAGL